MLQNKPFYAIQGMILGFAPFGQDFSLLEKGDLGKGISDIDS